MTVEVKTWYCYPEESTSYVLFPKHEGCPGHRDNSIVGAWRCPCPCHLIRNESTRAWHFKEYPGAPIEQPQVFGFSDEDQATVFAEIERMVNTPLFKLTPEERERIKKHNQKLNDLME